MSQISHASATTRHETTNKAQVALLSLSGSWRGSRGLLRWLKALVARRHPQTCILALYRLTRTKVLHGYRTHFRISPVSEGTSHGSDAAPPAHTLPQSSEGAAAASAMPSSQLWHLLTASDSTVGGQRECRNHSSHLQDRCARCTVPLELT